jgi:hypothetical protein
MTRFRVWTWVAVALGSAALAEPTLPEGIERRGQELGINVR